MMLSCDSEGGSASGAALVSKAIHEWDGTETALLPEWAVQSIERGYGANERGEPTGESPKIGFHLVRHPASDMQQMAQGKLNAPQILRARKVLSYAVSKLGLQEPPPHMLRPDYDQTVDYLELLCQDQIVPPGAACDTSTRACICLRPRGCLLGACRHTKARLSCAAAALLRLPG